MDKDLELFIERARGIGLTQDESKRLHTAILRLSADSTVRFASDAGLTAYMDKAPSEFGAAKGISLSQKEGEKISQNIARFVASRPVSESSRGFSFGSMFLLFRTIPALAVILLLVVGVGAVSAAAESALPGDFLYSVKVKLNEPVQAALKTSPEAKARFDAKLAETRLEEAAKLAAAGRLDDRTEADITARVTSHLEQAQQHVATIEATGDTKAADDVRAVISADLKAHTDVMQDLSAKMQSDIQERVKKILSDVNAQNHMLIDFEVDSSSSTSSEISHGRTFSVPSPAMPAIDAAASAQAKARKKAEDRFKTVLPDFFRSSSASSVVDSSSSSSSAATSPASDSHGYHSEYHSSGPNGSVDIEVQHESTTGNSVNVHVDSHVDIHNAGGVDIHLP